MIEIVQIATRVPADKAERAKQIADSKRWSLSTYLRSLLDEDLERHDRETGAA